REEEPGETERGRPGRELEQAGGEPRTRLALALARQELVGLARHPRARGRDVVAGPVEAALELGLAQGLDLLPVRDRGHEARARQDVQEHAHAPGRGAGLQEALRARDRDE